MIWFGLCTPVFLQITATARSGTGPGGGLMGVIAFNVGVILAYAVFVWVLARTQRNSK